MPTLNEDLKQLQQNLSTWKAYEETNNDKKIYDKET